MLQSVSDTQAGKFRQIIDLHGGKCFKMHFGKFFFQGAEHVKIPGKGQVRVETGYDMELMHAFTRPARLVQDIIDGHLICARFSLTPAERAELASIDADVRWIDVHVLDEIDPVAVLVLCNMGGHSTKREQVVRFEECDAVISGEPLPRENFIIDLF